MNTMKTIKALDLPDVFLLVQILIFGVTIPTVDTYSDLILSWNLFASGHHLWAVATFLPVLVCFAFTSVAFYQIPFSSPYHRYIGLLVLVLQVDMFSMFIHKPVVKHHSTGVAAIPLPLCCL